MLKGDSLGVAFVTSKNQLLTVELLFFILYTMQKYFDLLKACKTFEQACDVFISVLMDDDLTLKEKNVFWDVYTDFTQQF